MKTTRGEAADEIKSEAEWIPKVGEEVMLPGERGTITRLKRSGTVTMVAPPYMRVLIIYGRQRVALPYKISTLAPFNQRRGVAKKEVSA